MNWRWLIYDYADPALPISFWKRVRMGLRPVAIWKLPRKLRYSRYVFGLGLLPISLAPQLFRWLPLRVTTFAEGIALVLIFMIVAWIWGCVWYGVACRREHFHRIRLEGFDICGTCGYWLRGLGNDVKKCPECGAPRVGPPVKD